MNTPPLPQPAGKTCPQCGTGWDTASPYCPNCGYLVASQSSFWSSNLGVLVKVSAMIALTSIAVGAGSLGACLLLIGGLSTANKDGLFMLCIGIAGTAIAALSVWGIIKLNKLK